MGGFCLLLELHREGSALQPAQRACFCSPSIILVIDVLLKAQYLSYFGRQSLPLNEPFSPYFDIMAYKDLFKKTFSVFSHG